MRLVDTHCHLDFPDFRDDLAGVLKKAEDAGVVRIVSPGTDLESSKRAVRLASENASVFAAAGIHPHAADRTADADIGALRELAFSGGKVVAIGEIGLDYYKGYSTRQNQKKLLKECLLMAKELDYPVILHNREAGGDLLEMLKEVKKFGLKGVMHCFSGDEKYLKEVLDMGLFVSFAGNITFEKAEGLRRTAKAVPIERLMLETDSPYISPEPLRGKRNEPANVRYLLGVYSGLYGLSEEDVARTTTHNANYLFRLGIEEKGKVAYAIRDALYLNITNRCTNRCTFCTRDISNYVKGHNLRLKREPTFEEIIEEMGEITPYREVAFCGFGEPTLRLDIVKKVAGYVKGKGIKVRLVTNGEGDLINKRAIAAELSGLVDRVSVSLNSPDASSYRKLCRPVFGEKAYDAIIAFIKNCVDNGIKVEVTCLDLVGEGLSECRRKAEELGAEFRLRHFNVVG